MHTSFRSAIRVLIGDFSFTLGVTARKPSRTSGSVAGVVACLLLASCSHSEKKAEVTQRPLSPELKAVVIDKPVVLRLLAEKDRVEKVDYLHESSAKAYVENQLRHEKDESVEFSSQAATISVSEPDASGIISFVQDLSITRKDGVANLHDFAMPDLGETLRVSMNSLGKILKSGDYPSNSIYYVPSISLPATPVSVGDTWAMEASWLSLNDMVPYQLSMVTILKGFLECGVDTCADLEVSGEVKFQGPLAKEMRFNSIWQGRIYFALKSGTVVWSRTHTEERVVAEAARRDVNSCFEALLSEPTDYKLPNLTKPTCGTR
ncbi:MAG: hypothetical protein V4692_13805 [Bdellovibrionota bacterium]